MGFFSQQKRPTAATRKVKNNINIETAIVDSGGVLKSENMAKRTASRVPKPATEIGKSVTKEAMARAEKK